MGRGPDQWARIHMGPVWDPYGSHMAVGQEPYFSPYIWAPMAHMDPVWDPYGPKGPSYVARVGTIWTHMTPGGSIWAPCGVHMGSYEAIWAHMGYIWAL